MSDQETWNRQMLGEPSRSSDEDLYTLCKWLLFELRTEQFDRTLPGMFGRDGWIPTGAARGDAVRFARSLYQALALDRQRDRVTTRYVERMSYQSQQDLFERMPERIRDEVVALANGPRPTRSPRRCCGMCMEARRIRNRIRNMPLGEERRRG